MKKNRHQKLKELVEQYEIETQDELAEKLKEAGFDVTQATVSRDIRERLVMAGRNTQFWYIAIIT